MTNSPFPPAPAVAFTPALRIADDAAAWWIIQVTLRLRREVAWQWYQHGAAPSDAARLPPPADALLESLDLTRYEATKRAFFASDVTARYLGEQLAATPYPACPSPPRGSWEWVRQTLALDPASQFVLALALAARLDAALGPVCAACQHDSARPYPTLALAQRLWSDPIAVPACADPLHPLYRHGLLAQPIGVDWQQPLDMPAGVALALTGERPAAPPAPMGEPLPPDVATALALAAARELTAMQIVPLVGPPGGDHAEWARRCSAAAGRAVDVVPDRCAGHAGALLACAAGAWLRGRDLLVTDAWGERPHEAEPWFAAVRGVPVRWYLPARDAGAWRALPAELLAPPVIVPELDFAQRHAHLRQRLGTSAAGLDAAVREASRRFRLPRRALDRVADALRASAVPLDAAALFAACRAEAGLDLSALTQRVVPRFGLDDVVLTDEPARQLREIVRAMQSLTRVHYEWGTAAAWNESGLAVLFCGPPGTGKTMAAEAIGRALDLPLYRIDLSRVVNKYVGETEKNLARIFDAAERADSILFFDEADALFGKRTDVRDAHDRFANIEVSYLLERMERFKGLAILATNRRNDLDEAFLRRLRMVVEFPIPRATERRRIWQQAFPPAVDVSGVDLDYVAAQFELAGGHIRSAAFNACLQCAADGDAAEVPMAAVLLAVKRELQKLNRVVRSEQFGAYAHLLEAGA